MLGPALWLGERLDATVVNMRFVKPLDLEMLRTIATTHAGIVTLEENTIAGGAGSACAEALDAAGLSIPRLHIGIPDRFTEHGSRDDCLAAAGLDPVSIAAAIDRWRAEVPALKPARAASKLAAGAGIP
jgi:1-deoxy-D-xylulose-5-phosphate synthase